MKKKGLAISSQLLTKIADGSFWQRISLLERKAARFLFGIPWTECWDSIHRSRRLLIASILLKWKSCVLTSHFSISSLWHRHWLRRHLCRFPTKWGAVDLTDEILMMTSYFNTIPHWFRDANYHLWREQHWPYNQKKIRNWVTKKVWCTYSNSTKSGKPCLAWLTSSTII